MNPQPTHYKCAALPIELSQQMEEREGFEPPSPCELSVFKTDAINHSATFPKSLTPQVRSDVTFPAKRELIMAMRRGIIEVTAAG